MIKQEIKSKEINDYEKLQIYAWEVFKATPSSYYGSTTTSGVGLTLWTSEYYPRASTILDSQTGKWSATGEIFIWSSTTFISSYIINSGTSDTNNWRGKSASTIYYPGSGEKSGINIKFSKASKMSSYLINSYVNSYESQGFVYDSDGEKYPEDDHQLDEETGEVFWYVKVKEEGVE